MENMIIKSGFKDVEGLEQRTDEWFAERLGIVTASKFDTIMANFGKAFGNPAHEHAMRLALERVTGQQMQDGITTQYMAQGIENEHIARELYCEQHNQIVKEVGFRHNGYIGGSADGLLELENGIIEIKCVKFTTHFNRMISGGYNTAYRWQIAGYMMIYDRDFCDFVQYCADFPEDKCMYVHRVHRDKEDELKLITRLEEFERLVSTYVEMLVK